jgi:three-Cys-motif partner protein
MKRKPFELRTLKDDGHYTMQIGAWGIRKYQLVGTYAEMFASSMKAKWDKRVYIDLFAGPGRSKVKETTQIYPASPSIAMDVTTPFDKYIFSEEDPQSVQALEARARDQYGHLDVKVVPGDANENVDKIISKMPAFGKGHSVLTFCFADPQRLSDLDFRTITRLSSRYVDFLILVPTGMDATRNFDRFLDDDGTTELDCFLGTRAWRESWKRDKTRGMSRDMFVASEYTKQMRSIGYKHGGVDESVAIRLPEKNVILYRLAFYSKHELGEKFWKEAKRYSSEQTELF